MQHLKLHLWLPYLILITLLFAGCTDKRAKDLLTRAPSRYSPSSITEVGFVSVKTGNSTATYDFTAQQILQKNGALYMTGKGLGGVALGFGTWDLQANGIDPYNLFSAAMNIDSFQYAPSQGWTPDYYASQALGVSSTSYGSYAIMSGTLGASIVNLATNREVNRYPRPNLGSGATYPSDANYIYSAIATHPSLPIAYGMQRQNQMMILSLSSSGMAINTAVSYGSSGACCAVGSAVFGGKMYIAMQGKLSMYSLGSNGIPTKTGDNNTLQAVNISATDNLLYVHHEPNASQSAGMARPAGIYAFDAQGNQVNYFGIRPRKFAVSHDDGYIYANMDDLAVRVYSINWNMQ